MDHNKPLPSHTKFDYHECYAKIVLESLFPNQFDLEIKDKPDLQDKRKSIGIEVTQGRNPKQQEIESLYVKWSYDENINQEKLKRQIKKQGGNIVGGVLSGISESDDFGYSVTAFKDKIDKINAGGYLPMNRYDLFIFDDCLDMTPDRSIIKSLMAYMVDEQRERKNWFCNSYICTPTILWSLLLDSLEICQYDISSKQFNWAMEARKMVEQAEESDSKISR